MTVPIKRIAIIGAGAMGAAFASKFSDTAKDSVFLIAKGERHKRIRAAGLMVNGRRYDFTTFGPDEETSPADLLIVAVKNHHLPEAIRDIRQHVGPHTLILSLMNGIDSEEQLGAVYGMERVLYAVVVGIDAVREGNVVTFSKGGKLLFGEAKNRVLTERVRELQSIFDRSGISHETPEDMIRTLWWKFMINVGINQVSAVLKAPYRIFHESREARELMEAAMKETISIALACKVHLSEEDIENFYPFLMAMSPQGKTSMVQDIEAGRKTEVEMFAGRINELGKVYSIPTPVNEVLFRLLRIMEQYA